MEHRIAPQKEVEIDCGAKAWLIMWGNVALCPDCKRKGHHDPNCTAKVTIDLAPKY